MFFKARLKKFIDPEHLYESADRVRSSLAKGEPISNLMGLSFETLETLYSAGYKDFQNKSYQQAKKVFALLTFLAPQIKKYWSALGATVVALKDYNEGVKIYELLTQLDKKDPEAHYFMAFCLFKLGRTQEGQQALQRADILKVEAKRHE